MFLTKIMLLLLAAHVIGCAGRLPRDETSQISAEQEQPEQKKQGAMPTFTYRPGS